MNTYCDYCLKECKLGVDAIKVDDNVMGSECEEEEGNG